MDCLSEETTLKGTDSKYIMCFGERGVRFIYFLFKTPTGDLLYRRGRKGRWALY